MLHFIAGGNKCYITSPFPLATTTPKSNVGFCRRFVWASSNRSTLLQPPPPPSLTTPTASSLPLPPCFTTTIIVTVANGRHLHPSPTPTTTTERTTSATAQRKGKAEGLGFAGATSLRATWQPNDERRHRRRSSLFFRLDNSFPPSALANH